MGHQKPTEISVLRRSFQVTGARTTVRQEISMDEIVTNQRIVKTSLAPRSQEYFEIETQTHDLAMPAIFTRKTPQGVGLQTAQILSLKHALAWEIQNYDG